MLASGSAKGLIDPAHGAVKLRIVFVDDNVYELELTQRNMRCMSDEWSMEFLSGGAAALDSLAQQPADVVVSDMRMPGLDGWQLLAEVARSHPDTVRLVLSGHDDPGALMRLLGIAHQYIVKPADSETIKVAIAQTQLLQQLQGSPRLAALVRDAGAPPNCPAVFREIAGGLRRPSGSSAEAARILGRDLAMTADIMKLVNSAYFGPRRSVTSVDQAVSYLGLDTLGALVLGYSLFRRGGARPAALQELWQHGLHTALVARAIAQHEALSLDRAEEAFLAGMTHDLGRMLYGGSQQENHAELGAYLLASWGFPCRIVAAVALHHQPSSRAERGLDLTALIHIADRVAHAGPEYRDGDDCGIEAGLLDDLGLRAHLPRWVASARFASSGSIA